MPTATHADDLVNRVLITTGQARTRARSVQNPPIDREGALAMFTPVLLTPTEAAWALGIGRSKLYELMQAGILESVHIGAAGASLRMRLPIS